MRPLGPIYEKTRRMGDGYLLLGPPNVAFDAVTNWDDVGAIAGKGTVHPGAKDKEFKGGSPGIIGEAQFEEDGISVEFELYEFTLANLIKKLGFDPTDISFAAGSSTPVAFSEKKKLWGYNQFHLLHPNISVTAVTGSSNRSTPTTVVEGVDFAVDRPRGLVRRLPGSGILPGEIVTFEGTCIPPAQGVNTYTRGRSSEVVKYAAKYCIPMDDMSRLILNMYRIYFKGGSDPIDLVSNDYHKMKWMLVAMEDYTRDLDDNLYSWEEEVYYLPTADVGHGTMPQ